ncbi:hypothetical protein X805_16850 [Sphaerotilus natans subsp. natans DSM 6575]|uniref:FmdB family transcriptional regulator n=1 Tax=Sphaerotilus natans subsp. natans DSM 6575 TaxID=1286631 RepID=A0A059KMM8_9BURK|nr:hypothetical protein X805_16850 [Sphaerotilus natans subsp. natans DSM 6575]
MLQKMSDPVLTTCPACGAESFSKQVTAAGFQLKGSGWYVTDFRGGSGAATGATGGATAATAAAAAPAAAAADSGASTSSADSGSSASSASSTPCGGSCACH